MDNKNKKKLEERKKKIKRRLEEAVPDKNGNYNTGLMTSISALALVGLEKNG